MKKLSLTKQQYELLQEFFDKKKTNSLEQLSKDMMRVAVESGFNADFGLKVFNDGEQLFISVEPELNIAYRRALSSVSLLDMDERDDFANGKKNKLIVCDKHQVIAEGKYILVDFKEIINLIKGDLNDDR